MEARTKEVMRLKDANDPEEWCEEWNGTLWSGMPYHEFGCLEGRRKKSRKKAKGEKLKENGKRLWYGFP